MRHSSSSKKDVNNGRPYNDTKPIRVAVIGGKRTGKTSLIANLEWGGHNDTYYPTTQVHPTLFEFTPTSSLARAAFDELSPDAIQNLAVEIAKKGGSLCLSPSVQAALQRNKATSMLATAQKLRRSSSTKSNRRASDNLLGAAETGYVIHSKNPVYVTYNSKKELQEYALLAPSFGTSAQNTDLSWPLPQVSPILVELIDTPSFNPDQVVPFLEVSLHKRLTKDELHNLANEPAKPVLANPLLVASGASEMNGNVDGYIFVYSAVPSDHPPSYEEGTNSVSATGSAQLGGVLTPVATNSSSESMTNADSPVGLLETIRVGLTQAWKEYHTYTSLWSQGQEEDIYLFKQAMKNMWRLGSNATPAPVLTKNSIEGVNVVDTPNGNAGLPPIWIVCTHIDSPLKAPKLVQEGMKKAKEWGCGFVTVDNDRPADASLALMIRDIVETNRMQKKRK